MTESRSDGSSTLLPGYFTDEEQQIGTRFLTTGYVIQEAEDRAKLDLMRGQIAALAAKELGMAAPDDPAAFLDTIGQRVQIQSLNAFRLAVFEGIQRTPWFREAYYAVARRSLQSLVGNELVMQRRIGLSIQIPDDDSSLLPVHADTWSGVSSFEVVLWIPFVDVFKTKSMFILPLGKDRPRQERLNEFNGKSVEDLFHSIEPDLTWLDIKYGQVLIFSQTVMHGNRVNRETGTRWSMNCRFKSAFSPYADKRLGEFFDPITLRPASRLALDYKLPAGFDE
jgi:sporadic carbohydrate cluster 2OG-Fe(II) oxygenase